MKLFKRFIEWLRYDFPSLIPYILLIGTGILMLVFVAILIVSYISNYIDEGVIVDKDYDAAYTSVISYSSGNGGIRLQSVYHPESYQFKLIGEKDGETVYCWITVPECDYEKYHIGDYYP